MSQVKEVIVQGLWKNNSALVQLLGMCPLLAVTSTATNALGKRTCGSRQGRAVQRRNVLGTPDAMATHIVYSAHPAARFVLNRTNIESATALAGSTQCGGDGMFRSLLNGRSQRQTLIAVKLA